MNRPEKKLPCISGGSIGQFTLAARSRHTGGVQVMMCDASVQNKQVSIEEQYLPKQFNSDSILDAEVVGNKSNTFEFDLKPSK